jgi:hypothetical protein
VIEKFANDGLVAGDIAIGDGSAWITDVEGAEVARVDLATGKIVASVRSAGSPTASRGASAVGRKPRRRHRLADRSGDERGDSTIDVWS